MLTIKSIAQAQNGYTLVGSARSGSTVGCIQLTNSGNGQIGAIWFDERISLVESFELAFTINLGSNPVGADGLVMVFQTIGNQALGEQAGGIGYKGLKPSLGIEFDTNQNFEAGDPAEDHIALMRDGISDHRLNTSFAVPVPISSTQNNVKDGRNHNVTVRWDTTTQTISVEVDCVQRISQSIDLINTVFLGTPEVIWGFTATTGARNNEHVVCFQKENRLDTIPACRNEQISLSAPFSSNGQYKWAPDIGLDNSHTQTPHLKVGNSQLYTVQYFDQCGLPKLDSVFVNAKGVNFSIGNDRQACENDTVRLVPTLTPTNVPVMYRWSTGETTPQLTPKTSGQYSLTITADGCSVSDSTTVTFNPLPKLVLSANATYNCPGSQSIQLDPQIGGTNLQYLWFPGGSKAPTLAANSPGMYTVQITTDMGCSATQGFTILDNCSSLQLFVPDAFTPNGDGINDLLKWQGESSLEARMKIFDRWGELVFVSTAFSPYWDGTYQGNLCMHGTYTWCLEYWPRLTTKQFTIYGKVLLLK